MPKPRTGKPRSSPRKKMSAAMKCTLVGAFATVVAAITGAWMQSGSAAKSPAATSLPSVVKATRDPAPLIEGLDRHFRMDETKKSYEVSGKAVQKIPERHFKAAATQLQEQFRGVITEALKSRDWLEEQGVRCRRALFERSNAMQVGAFEALDDIAAKETVQREHLDLLLQMQVNCLQVEYDCQKEAIYEHCKG